MGKSKVFAVFLFVKASFAMGQQNGEKVIHGKIIVDSMSVEGVNVLNIVNEKATVTDQEGEFTILAKADDLLLITAVNLEINRRLIEEEDLKQETILIEMIPKVTALKEVVINKYPKINAVALGIIPKAIKEPTWAERGRYSPPKNIIDRIKIKVTGKDPAKEKAILTEKKRALIKKLEFVFDEEYYVTNLKVQKDYIRGFQFFCVEDPDFRRALESKNKALNKFLLIALIVPLAVNYNQYFTCE